MIKRDFRTNRKKKIHLCDCTYSVRHCPRIVDLNSKRLVEVNKEGYCVYCGHHAWTKQVEEDWDATRPIYGRKKEAQKADFYKIQRIDDRFIYMC